MLQSGKNNCLVQGNCSEKKFWKMFTFFATVLVKLPYCVVVATYSILVYAYAKIEYVSIRTYPSKK